MSVPSPLALWEFIIGTYNMEELETLCFQLGVQFDDLEGETREGKARELVEHLQRTDRLDELAALLAEERSERYQLVFAKAVASPPGQTAAKATAGVLRIDKRLVLVLAALFLIALIIWIGSIWRSRGGTRPETSSTTTVAAGVELEETATLNSPTVALPTSPTPVAQLSTAGSEVTPEESPAVVAETSPTSEPAPTPATTAMTATGVITRTITTPAGTQLEQVFVPGGSFMMGMESAGHGPVHQVTLDEFWLDKTETTNQQYEACVLAGVCLIPNQVRSVTRNSYYGNNEYADYPVTAVDWNRAQAYCEWAGGRLPTEAEWEYAARGPENFIYPWGNKAPSCARLNYGQQCVGDTARAGSYIDGASWVGALDMAGNVSEFVADWYAADYYQTSPEVNPIGPASGSFIVVRGGDYGSASNVTDARYREWSSEHYPRFGFGVRCAYD